MVSLRRARQYQTSRLVHLGGDQVLHEDHTSLRPQSCPSPRPHVTRLSTADANARGQPTERSAVAGHSGVRCVPMGARSRSEKGAKKDGQPASPNAVLTRPPGKVDGGPVRSAKETSRNIFHGQQRARPTLRV